jgi:hypothetical protein
MAAQFTEVTLEDMEKFLKRGFRTLRPRRGEERKEIYIDLSLSAHVAIRIWTSIGVGRASGAGVGQDAIRVQLVSKEKNRPLMTGKAPIVKRTQNWRDSLQDRIEDYIEQYEDREEYWESRAGAPASPETEDRPPAPDGITGPPPSDKQVAYALTLLKNAPSDFNWTQYGFKTPPDEEGLKSLSGRSVSKLIEALKSAKPATPASPAEPPPPAPSAPRGMGVATFTKLRDGSWGLRGMGLQQGDSVLVSRRDGSRTKMEVGRIVWKGPDGTTVAEIGGARRASMGEPEEPYSYGEPAN